MFNSLLRWQATARSMSASRGTADRVGASPFVTAITIIAVLTGSATYWTCAKRKRASAPPVRASEVPPVKVRRSASKVSAANARASTNKVHVPPTSSVLSNSRSGTVANRNVTGGNHVPTRLLASPINVTDFAGRTWIYFFLFFSRLSIWLFFIQSKAGKDTVRRGFLFLLLGKEVRRFF